MSGRSRVRRESEAKGARRTFDGHCGNRRTGWTGAQRTLCLGGRAAKGSSALEKAKFSATDIEKIMGHNWARVLNTLT